MTAVQHIYFPYCALIPELPPPKRIRATCPIELKTPTPVFRRCRAFPVHRISGRQRAINDSLSENAYFLLKSLPTISGNWCKPWLFGVVFLFLPVLELHITSPPFEKLGDRILIRSHWACVIADYAQGQLHCSGAPVDFVWSSHHKTERMVLGGWWSVSETVSGQWDLFFTELLRSRSPGLLPIDLS